jgi:integration host factor subunit beta
MKPAAKNVTSEGGAVTKSELIDAVAEGAGLTGRDAAEVVTTVFSAMEDALVRGDRIEIRGFGSFRVKHYAAYTGRNPRTGDQVAVPAKVAPVFKVGRELRYRLMKAPDDEQVPWGTKLLSAGPDAVEFE